MANIVLEFNTTVKQDDKLAKVLARVNADRVDAGEAEFATIDEYLRWVLIEGVKSYVRAQDEIDSGDVAAAWDAADDSVKSQVETLLGL